jgi:hypothetical protein
MLVCDYVPLSDNTGVRNTRSNSVWGARRVGNWFLARLLAGPSYRLVKDVAIDCSVVHQHTTNAVLKTVNWKLKTAKPVFPTQYKRKSAGT